MKEFTDKLRTNYQVMRNSETTFHVEAGISMTIKTFVRIKPHKDEDSHVHISFYDKKNTYESGTIHELLKQKHFKPEMVYY